MPRAGMHAELGFGLGGGLVVAALLGPQKPGLAEVGQPVVGFVRTRVPWETVGSVGPFGSSIAGPSVGSVGMVRARGR